MFPREEKKKLRSNTVHFMLPICIPYVYKYMFCLQCRLFKKMESERRFALGNAGCCSSNYRFT